MIKVTNLANFDKTVQDWFKAVETAATEAAAGIAHEILDHVLEISPQYSGDFVANWNMSVNIPDTSFKIDAVSRGAHDYKGSDGLASFQAYSMGSSPAISYAKANAVGKLANFKLGDTIFLTNMSSHLDTDEGGFGVLDMYSMKIEEGKIKLRPVNTGAFRVAHRAVAAIGFNYANLGPVQLAGLRKYGS